MTKERRIKNHLRKFGKCINFLVAPEEYTHTHAYTHTHTHTGRKKIKRARESRERSWARQKERDREIKKPRKEKRIPHLCVLIGPVNHIRPLA